MGPSFGTALTVAAAAVSIATGHERESVTIAINVDTKKQNSATFCAAKLRYTNAPGAFPRVFACFTGIVRPGDSGRSDSFTFLNK